VRASVRVCVHGEGVVGVGARAQACACASLALLMQYDTCRCHIVICSVSGSTIFFDIMS
jgi:hypothetical protein